MRQTRIEETLRASTSSFPPKDSAPSESTLLNVLDIIRLLRSAGGTLFAQTALYAELARVEWEEEKNRLLKMLLVILLGLACLLCAMLFVGTLVLALSWETVYRIPVLIALIVVYGGGTGLAWRRFQILSMQSTQSFAATREEIAADISLLRSKL